MSTWSSTKQKKQSEIHYFMQKQLKILYLFCKFGNSNDRKNTIGRKHTEHNAIELAHLLK